MYFYVVLKPTYISVLKMHSHKFMNCPGPGLGPGHSGTQHGRQFQFYRIQTGNRTERWRDSGERRRDSGEKPAVLLENDDF